MMQELRLVKWGHSLALRFPKSIVKRACLREGDVVVIKASVGRVEMHRPERVLCLEDLVAQITRENRHPEIDWGPPVGREKIGW
jgi:antitoxin MazE